MTSEQIEALHALAHWWLQLSADYKRLQGAHPADYPQLAERRVLFFGTRGVDYTEVQGRHLDALMQLAMEHKA